MAKQAAPLDPHKQFIKTLEDMAFSRSMGDRFNDFLEMAYCAVAKQMTSGEAAEKLEGRYMLAVKRHRPEDVQRMPELLGLTQMAVAPGGCDFLGKISSELSILNPQIGQFFTPYDICRMMAEITLQEVAETITKNGFVTISEPASGSGAMILAAADVIQKKGFDPSTSMYVEANDLADAAYKMTYLQLSARGIAARVRRMNTLSLEVFEGAYTTAMPAFIEKHGDAFERWRQDGIQPHDVSSDIAATIRKKEPQKAGPRIGDEIAPRPPLKTREQFDLF